MIPFSQCPICGGELDEHVVEKLLRGGVNTAVVNALAEVCLRCGERLYSQKTVREFELIRAKLERQEVTEFQPKKRLLMSHGIYRVTAFEISAPYALRVQFDDGTRQTIDFEPVLAGELYQALRDLDLFNQVQVDPETHTLVWPNGADFDPATLHDWPTHADALAARARRWELADVKN